MIFAWIGNSAWCRRYVLLRENFGSFNATQSRTEHRPVADFAENETIGCRREVLLRG